MCCLPLFISLYFYVERSEHCKIKLKFSKLSFKGVHIVCTGFLHVHKAHGPMAALGYVGTSLMSPKVFLYSSFPLPLSPLWHRTYKGMTLHHGHTHHTMAMRLTLKDWVFQEISPMVSGFTPVPCSTSSVKTPVMV